MGLGACAQLEPRRELPFDAGAPPGSETPLDRTVLAAETAHPGQSGFRLVSEGREAFVIRWHTAGAAERSIDVQTYIWHADTTGLALASQLVAAADRGVRVRLLVDDMDARAKNLGFAALHAHPHIDVRMFNPFASRDGFFAFLFEGIGSFNRINRRMHNKSWIADNRIAMVGGRNLGDEYFGASASMNFEDLDFAMAGPVVQDVSASFDRFWNSAQAYPIDVLDPDSVSEENLLKLRETLTAASAEAETGWYAEALRGSETIKRLFGGDWTLEWSSGYQFVSDDPAKATGTLGEDASEVGKVLFPAMLGATSELFVISPYFVPGEKGADALIGVAQAEKQVRVLTNSLAANDVAAVHGGYASQRKNLLAGGVELFEIKPTGGEQVPSSLKGSSGAALHTKAMIIDGERLFVGSYNLDPRSTSLNCEQGVLVESPVLAKQLEAIFGGMTTGERAWTVHLQDDDLTWTDGNETYDSDPKASAGRKFQAWFARAFGLESQL
jgi:putative cardiolipin synthase